MNISLCTIPIRDLVEGYRDDAEQGVRGYRGLLDIRPPYQREFVYKDEQRDAVIHTVMHGYPLNVMYWAVREDGTYEIIDGQQRTVSICKYAANEYSVRVEEDRLCFANLTGARREQFLDYGLTVYLCEGSDEERLRWFRTINIAGVRLTDQELRNAVYSGPWVTDAKRYFSRTQCAAHRLAAPYMKGSSIRQEYLETAIKWISRGDIEGYMGRHQHDADALVLWQYFQTVIAWVEVSFRHDTSRKRLMRGLSWGEWYNAYHDRTPSPEDMESRIARLLLDDEVTCKNGIYEYVLTGRERALSLRAFSESQRQEAYASQRGLCAHCGKHFDIGEMEADHITPWHLGGKTTRGNCQMLCRKCNREKSGK